MADLRAARDEDIPRLIEIRAAVRENRLVSKTIGADDYRPFIEDARCWVAETGGAVRAFAALDAARASVWALFVDPGHEGGGLGRALLERLIVEARARGLAALRLETEAGTRAEAFYRKAGWLVDDRGEGVSLRLSLRVNPD